MPYISTKYPDRVPLCFENNNFEIPLQQDLKNSEYTSSLLSMVLVAP